MNESQLIKEQDRAIRAKKILEDPIVKEAYEGVCNQLRGDWENKKGLTPEDRERIWDALYTFKTIWRHFERVVQTGQLAETQLVEIRKEKDRATSSRSEY